LPNRKSTSEKEVNNIIRKPILTYITSPFRMWIHMKMCPNIDKYLWNLMVKFQLDPTVGFEVMLNSVKLNGKNSYAKIRI